MTDYRKLLLEACDLLDEYVTPSADRYCGRDSLRVDELRSLASSHPPDLEGPMSNPAPEEIEALATALYDAYDETPMDADGDHACWFAMTREAWRLGARTKEK